MIDLYEQMIADGVEPNTKTYGSILHAFGSKGDFENVFKTWNDIKRTQGDLITAEVMRESILMYIHIYLVILYPYAIRDGNI